MRALEFLEMKDEKSTFVDRSSAPGTCQSRFEGSIGFLLLFQNETEKIKGFIDDDK